MRYLTLLWFILASTTVFAQDEKRELPLPFVTIVQPPTIPELDNSALSEESSEEIRKLIVLLSGALESDLRLSLSYSGMFVPVGQFGAFGEWRGAQVTVSQPFRRLVELGPITIPFLLSALDDDTPTEIVITAVKSQDAIAGGMAFDEILHGNPVNPIENYRLRLNRSPFSDSIHPKDKFRVSPEMESYRVKVGDVCMAVLGQIVGRHYVLLRPPHVKSAGVLVCSPVHRKNLRNRLTTIWKTEHPKQKLLESLVFDFSTRGIQQIDSLDYSEIGNDFQIESIKRLLYYYPTIAVPLIVARLDGLQTTDDYVADAIQNGIRSENMVDAVVWSKDKAIIDALTRLAERAKEDELLKALHRVSVIRTDGENSR